MRVIHLINHCRFGHGNVHAAIDLACAQAAGGDVVAVASGPGELQPLLDQERVAHFALDQESRKPAAVLRMIRGLRRIISEFRPDIIHAHMMTGAVIGWIATRRSPVRLVTTVHNAFDKHAILMGLGDRVIAVSRSVSLNMKARGIPSTKLRVVLNGTLGAPRRDFFGRSEPGLLHPNVVTICGLHDRKGVRDLIAAFELAAKPVPAVHLYIVGDGPERRVYEEIAIQTSAANRIHFIGQFIDTKSLLADTDIFVLASHADPAPLVLPEAREGGCAIIATNVDGIPELLEQGKAGILVPPRDPARLGDAMIDLLTQDLNLRAAKHNAASNLGFWSTGRVAEQTRGVYAELLRS